MDMGLTGWVIREEKPLVRPVMKPRNHNSYVFFPDDPCMHFQSYMGLPLIFFGRLYGVMNLIGYQENHWEEDEIQALFAGQTIITSISLFNGQLTRVEDRVLIQKMFGLFCRRFGHGSGNGQYLDLQKKPGDCS